VQIRDFNRKFSEAASGYYRLAQLVPSLSFVSSLVRDRPPYFLSQVTNEEERMDALECGVRCSVLAPAGPQRSRLLALYYKDERAKQLENFPILEKMFFGRILRADEVKAFESKLDEHQVAKNADGVTILEQAIREHNLLAATQIYNNISFEQLGALIGVDAQAVRCLLRSFRFLPLDLMAILGREACLDHGL